VDSNEHINSIKIKHLNKNLHFFCEIIYMIKKQSIQTDILSGRISLIKISVTSILNTINYLLLK